MKNKMSKLPAYLIMTVFFSILMCCEVKIESNKANATELFLTGGGYSAIQFNKYKYGDIEYGVFYSTNSSSQSGNGVSVVNLTKDKLEIEKLKIEINNLKTINQ